MLAWRHSGFSVHNQVRVAAGDTEGRKSLAGYMLRAPFSLEKITYDAARGMVIYRSKLHATLRRNFQVMPGAQWLELLCRHVPNRHEHMVRYYGRYSSRTRGSEQKRPGMDEPDAEIPHPSRQSARAAWAKLIRKVYEVDPVLCPKCGAQMRVIALVEEPAVIERILSWLGLREPLPASGPAPPEGVATPRHREFVHRESCPIWYESGRGTYFQRGMSLKRGDWVDHSGHGLMTSAFHKQGGACRS